MSMTTSAGGRKDLASREGRRLKAYRCSAGVLTIGVGHTSMAGLPKVTPGLTITAEECEEIFIRDLKKYEAAVNKAVKVPLTQNQFDALVSLCFNIGTGAFAKSTLVRKLNAGDYEGAAKQFLVWSKQPELLPRRQKEKAQFERGAKKAPKKPVQPVEPVPAPTEPPAPEVAPEPPVEPSEGPLDSLPSLKPLAKSKELWAGVTAIFATMSGFISDLTGLDAKAQVWILSGLTAAGVGAGVFMIVNRLTARKNGER